MADSRNCRDYESRRGRDRRWFKILHDQRRHMRERRALKSKKPEALIPDKNLTSGPGKLCIAFGIDKSFDKEDLLGNRVWIAEGEKFSTDSIACGKRVGIDYAEEYAEKPWRFWIKNNPFVSRK